MWPISRPAAGQTVGVTTSLWLAANAVDLLTTVAGLYVGLREANALPALIVERYSFDGLYVWKTVGTLAMVAVVRWLALRYPRVWLALRIGGWLVAIVCVQNLAHILAQIWAHRSG